MKYLFVSIIARTRVCIGGLVCRIHTHLSEGGHCTHTVRHKHSDAGPFRYFLDQMILLVKNVIGNVNELVTEDA